MSFWSLSDLLCAELWRRGRWRLDLRAFGERKVFWKSPSKETLMSTSLEMSFQCLPRRWTWVAWWAFGGCWSWLVQAWSWPCRAAFLSAQATERFAKVTKSLLLYIVIVIIGNYWYLLLSMSSFSFTKSGCKRPAPCARRLFECELPLHPSTAAGAVRGPVADGDSPGTAPLGVFALWSLAEDKASSQGPRSWNSKRREEFNVK